MVALEGGIHMKQFLYLVLTLVVVFDAAEGTYLWQLLSERKGQSVETTPAHGKSSQSTQQTQDYSSMAAPPAFKFIEVDAGHPYAFHSSSR